MPCLLGTECTHSRNPARMHKTPRVDGGVDGGGVDGGVAGLDEGLGNERDPLQRD